MNMKIHSLAIASILSMASAVVDEVILENYIGHWYQMYADAEVVDTFERGSFCATADYRLNNDSTISLFNSQANGAADGPLSNVTGTAYATSVVGELSVVFTPGEAAPVPAPYWILQLGPVVNGLYDYSVVSDNLNVSLFVLARDPTTFNEQYDAEVQAFLQESGFTRNYNTPIKSYQEADCHYADGPVYVDPQEPKTLVDEVVLQNYVGRWYQMYADAWVIDTFERGSFCATADYRLNNDSTISLFNSQSNGAPDGPLSNVTGTAYATDTVGVLSIVFTPGDAAPFPAPYWILKLGPVVNGLYDYSIVSDNLNLSLFVLARDPATFNAQYDAEVKDFLAANGFTGKLNTPISLYQDDDCRYAGEPVYVDPVNCPEVSPIADLDIAEYTRATWYIQQQQVTHYQTEEDLYCVLATYDADGEFGSVSVPNFDGPVIGVHNYENVGGVNVHPQGNGSVLCAREPDTANAGALIVAPCQLPNAFGGNYWVVAVGYDDSNQYMEWAVVSGGQPSVEYDDGCTTKLTGNHDSGLWIFSREQVISEDNLQAAHDALTKLGYTLSQLIDVPQAGCNYQSALIKPDTR